jgi:O-antigen ligase
MTLTTSGPDVSRDGAATGERLTTGATVLLVAWGALAIGAVYPWGYVPLATGCALAGAFALQRARRDIAAHRGIVFSLAAVALAIALQLLPLPETVRAVVSPRLDGVLAQLDLGFALQTAAAGAEGPHVLHPLTMDAIATARGLLLFVAFSLLLVGLAATLGRVGAGRLVPWIVAFGFLLAAFGIVQRLVLGDHAWGGMKIYGLWAPHYKLTTPFGPFVNKNHFAGWMLMGLPLAAGYALGLAHVGMRRVRPDLRHRLLWLSSPDGGRVQLAAVAVACMAVALVMTRSRSGVGCFAVAMGVAAAVAARHQTTRTARFVVAGVLALIVLVPVVGGQAELARRFEHGTSDPSVRLRLDVWSVAGAIAKDFPLAGTGVNTFAVAAIPYSTPGKDYHFREAHNDYLQLAVEGGLLVGVPATVVLWCVVAAIRRRVAEDRPDSSTYWVRVGAVTGLAAIALQSVVEFSLQMPGNAVLSVVLLAIAVHRQPATPADDVRPRHAPQHNPTRLR